MVKISLQSSAADLRDMGLNIKHGLIDEQDIKNIAGLLACRYIIMALYLTSTLFVICFVSLFILLLNRNSFAQMHHHRTCDVKTKCYIVFVSHSLHWRCIKTALQEYVITQFIIYLEHA